MRFPTPKFYAYYSLKVRDNIQCTTLDKASALTSLMNASRIPPHNEKGWQWNIKSEYEFTDEKEVQDIVDTFNRLKTNLDTGIQELVEKDKELENLFTLEG